MKNEERTAATKHAILDTAARLFMEKGYDQTSIGDILGLSGVARGSLYYHFKSKEDVLDGVLERVTAQITARARGIADDPALTAHEKLARVIASLSISKTQDAAIIQEMHAPSNALLHQKSIIQTIRAVAPLMAGVVEQGAREGVFHVAYPLETVEILLVASLFLFDEGMFKWSAEEMAARMLAFVNIAETVLGAAQGSLQFIGGVDGDEE